MRGLHAAETAIFCYPSSLCTYLRRVLLQKIFSLRDPKLAKRFCGEINSIIESVFFPL